MSVLKKTKLLPLAAVITTILSGCGGNDNKDKPVFPETPVNQPPVVSVQNITAAENIEVTLTAIASDADGEISSYGWRKTSGPNIELTDITSSTLTFSVPSVDEDTEAAFEVTVTDNDGATQTATATVIITDIPVEPRIITINGKVTDNPIPNARVSVVIGDNEPIEVTADASGNYSVQLTYDESKAGELVKITARGEESDSKVKLISNVGSLEQIAQAATSNDIVTKDELFAVNVTNVSTAVNALMKNANGGDEIDTVEEFEKAGVEFEPNMVMPLATALKMIIDFSDDSTQPQNVGNRAPGLPDGNDDTADFVEDLSAVQAYILSALQDSSTEYAQAASDIVDDANLISSNVGDEASLTGTFYFKVSDDKFEGDRLTLNDDGTGELRNRNLETSPADITWQIDDTGLILSYGTDGVYTFNEDVTSLEPLVGDFDLLRTRTLIKLLSSTDNIAQISVQHTHVYRPQDSENNTEDQLAQTPQIEAQLIKEAVVKNPDTFFDTTDVIYTIPTPSGMGKSELEFRNIPSYVDDQYKGSERGVMRMNFDANSVVTFTEYLLDENKELVTEDIAVTVQNVNGHLTATTIDLSSQFDFAFFSDTSPFYVNGMLTRDETDGTASVSPISSYLLKKDEDATWSDTNVQGIYTLNWNLGKPNQHFWIELKEDNVALTIKTRDVNNNGELSNEDFSVEAGLWMIDEDGVLNIRRYSQATDTDEPTQPLSCSSDTFVPEISSQCKVWHERKWDLQSIKGNQYFVVHEHKFSTLSSTLPATGIVTGATAYSSRDNRKWTKIGTEDSARPVVIPASLLPSTLNP